MSFDALPDDAWPMIAAALAKPWPVEASAHDLRWHAARHALRGERLPAVRDLADRWGWPGGKNRVQRLIDSRSWYDEARPWGWGGTSAGQPRDTTGTPAVDETPIVDDARDTTGTAAGQPRDSRAFPQHPTPLHPSTHEFQDTPKPPAEPPARLAPVESEPDAPKPTTPELVTVPVEPGVPRWTPPARECNGHPRSAVATAVLACIEAVRQSPVTADNTATDAKAVLALWRALGRPDPASFASEFILVTTWAQQSPDPMAARNLRGEGWDGGVYRARAVGTLTRQAAWGDRLDAAQAWDRAGRPTTATGPPNARGSPVESDDEHNARVEAERFRMFGPLPRQPNHPGP